MDDTGKFSDLHANALNETSGFVASPAAASPPPWWRSTPLRKKCVFRKFDNFDFQKKCVVVFFVKRAGWCAT